MKFIELAQQRKSIRKYKDTPVPDAVLQQILEAGRLAPTAKNLQPFHFVVVREAKRLGPAYPAPFLQEAPLVIAVCTEPSKGWTRDRSDSKNYCEVDATIAADHMVLAAEDLGLGSCWIAAFDPQKVTEALKLPEGVDPLLLLPMGCANEEGRKKVRKSLDELVHYDQW